MLKIKIIDKNYYQIANEHDWQNAVNENKTDWVDPSVRMFSDAVPNRDKIIGLFEGVGIYYINSFLDNPVDYGVYSRKVDVKELKQIADDLNQFLSQVGVTAT
ncbi:MAG: hypothetical protein C4589_00300 [Peptococcaceae bacterium]|jgi:hypothetical protein|nr:MAG: hypothetical protein C4589_00300 [Peptococcaceae bacterium]